MVDVSNGRNLPAYTNVENLLKLIEAFRKKSGNEEEAKPMFGKGDSAYNNTKSALRELKIIKEDSCEFTDLGRNFAYSSEEEKKGLLGQIIREYKPYELLMDYVFSKEEVKETSIDDIVSFWGKNNFGSTERNITDGAKFFCSIVEFVGLGKYKKGTGNRPSRIIWNTQEVTSFLGDVNMVENVETVDKTPDSKANLELDVEKEGKAKEKSERLEEMTVTPSTKSPTIIIKVDMTSWTDERIKSFFKYAYGQFSDSDNDDL